MSNETQDVVRYAMIEGIAEGTIYSDEMKIPSFVVFEKSKSAILKLDQTPTKGKDENGRDKPMTDKYRTTEITIHATKEMGIVEYISQLKARLFQNSAKSCKVFVKYAYESNYNKETKVNYKGARMIWIEPVFSEKGAEMLEKQAEFLVKRAKSLREALAKQAEKPNNHARSTDGTPKVDGGDLPF